MFPARATHVFASGCCGLIGLAATQVSAEPTIARWTLDNGMRVSIMHVPEAESFSVQTYIPCGLTSDDAEHVLWMRLLERLITQTSGQSDGKAVADHVWLETWSWPEQWRRALEEHAQLMQGRDFTEQHLRVYQEDVLAYTEWAEQDWERGGRVAVCHWDDAVGAICAQALNHGRTEVGIGRTIRGAKLAELRAYRDRYWCRPQGAMLFVAGSVPTPEVKAMVKRLFGRVSESRPATSRPAPPSGHVVIRTDLRKKYVVLCWPVADVSARDKAALYFIRELMFWNYVRELSPHEMQRMFAYAGMHLPFGTCFWVAVYLEPEMPAEAVENELRAELRNLRAGRIDPDQLEGVRKELLRMLNAPLGPILTINNPGLDNVVRAELGFAHTWADLEWNLGDSRGEVFEQVGVTTVDDIRAAARKYLSDRNATIFVIQPAQAAGEHG